MSESVPFDKIRIRSGFWADKQKLVRSVTLDSVYDRFYETGRIGAFEIRASLTFSGIPTWRNGWSPSRI